MKSRNAQRTFHPVLLLVFQIIRNWTLGTCVLEHKQWIAFFFMMPYQIQVDYCCRKEGTLSFDCQKSWVSNFSLKISRLLECSKEVSTRCYFFFPKPVKHCAFSEFSSEFSKVVFSKFQLRKIFLDLYALCIFISSVLSIKAPTYAFK